MAASLGGYWWAANMISVGFNLELGLGIQQDIQLRIQLEL